jgi:hypothetical protein
MSGSSLAWRDGWQAHLRCHSIGANPYLRDTQNASFKEWEAGWRARELWLNLGKDQ